MSVDLPELPPEKGVWDEQAISRRGLLEGALGILAVAGAAAVAVPAGRFLVGNSLEPAKMQWVELGAVESFPPDQVTRVNFTTNTKDAWRTVSRRGTIYVYSDDGGATFVALNGTCTHLGCIVQWRPDQEKFTCPCHAAAFARNGDVLSGPPPKPLHVLAVKIENGRLYAEI